MGPQRNVMMIGAKEDNATGPAFPLSWPRTQSGPTTGQGPSQESRARAAEGKGRRRGATASKRERRTRERETAHAPRCALEGCSVPAGPRAVFGKREGSAAGWGGEREGRRTGGKEKERERGRERVCEQRKRERARKRRERSVVRARGAMAPETIGKRQKDQSRERQREEERERKGEGKEGKRKGKERREGSNEEQKDVSLLSPWRRRTWPRKAIARVATYRAIEAERGGESEKEMGKKARERETQNIPSFTRVKERQNVQRLQRPRRTVVLSREIER